MTRRARRRCTALHDGYDEQGEVSQFTSVLEDARRHAIDRMIDNAKLLGANAVIAMRFDSAEIGKARAEVVAYGSAVVVKPSA